MQKNIKIEVLLKRAFDLPDCYVMPEEEISDIRALTGGILPYFIAFTARSGSTFLTHELRGTGVLSCPHEWFNWDYVKQQEYKGSRSARNYIADTIKGNKSQNGIFGCEVNWLQLCAINSIVPVQNLFANRIRWFFLRRRNLIAQSISNYVADRSKIFHSYQIDPNAIAAIEKVEYDADSIKSLIRGFLQQERAFEVWLSQKKIAPINIFYEDLIESPTEAVHLFANVMGVWLPDDESGSKEKNPIRKISTQKNNDFERRFRESESQFLHDCYEIRSKILKPASSL